MMNKINCKPKKWQKSKKKDEIIQYLTTKKIKITNKYKGARTKPEWYTLEDEKYEHNVKNTVTKTNSWFLKAKNQILKWEQIHFIVQYSRHKKDNESSQTKIHPPERNKKGKKNRIQTYKTFCKKMFNKFLRSHLWKKKCNCFSMQKCKNLTPKSDWIFIETKSKSLILHKKTSSSS